MKLLVKSPVEHDGVQYKDGDTLTATDEQGAALVRVGAADELPAEVKETAAQRKAREAAEAEAAAIAEQARAEAEAKAAAGDQSKE